MLHLDTDMGPRANNCILFFENRFPNFFSSDMELSPFRRYQSFLQRYAVSQRLTSNGGVRHW